MKKILSVLTMIAMLICLSVPTFAAEAPIPSKENTQQQVSEIKDDLISARENDGKISKSEQNKIASEYSKEAIKEFNETIDEELEEVLSQECADVSYSTEGENSETKTIDLECGAQVIITTEITEIEEDSSDLAEETAFSKIKSFFILEASASTASYGTFKHGTYITVVGVGTIKLNVTNTLKASSSGLKITKVSATTNSSGQMHDVEKKCKITKASAGKGSTCKTLAGVRWYCTTPYGNLPKKWKKLTSSFKVTSINTSKKKVNYTCSVSSSSSNSW